MQKIKIGDISIDVIQKDIKNIHLSVHPPTGRVRISAPSRINLDTLRIYAISKIGWIRKHQKKMRGQERIAPRDYIERESHYYLGKRYLLRLFEEEAKPKVILRHETIDLYVRKNSNKKKKQEILESWYREKLREITKDFIDKWEKVINVRANEFGIKRMKTKWGTCNQKAKRIWLNLELAKKPIQCIEYITVHELVHLIERKHNDTFIALMNKFMPQWKHYKEELNRFPLSHEEWGY
jgi:predicted metal-dependent hydrolase